MPEPASQPLAGRTVVVTRASDQSSELVNRLTGAGARVLELPLIQTAPESDAHQRAEVFKELWTYEWMVFTSTNGVRYFFDYFFKAFDDIRALGGARIAVVGKATAQALQGFHLRADLVPEESTAEGLAKALEAEQTLDNLKILVVTGNRGGETLVERLEAASAIVDSLQVYRTEKTDLSANPEAESFRVHGADAIIFASGSAVESFVEQAGALQMAVKARRPAGCSIGPVTSDAMRRLGVPVDVVAREPSVDGLVDSLSAFFQSHPRKD